MVKADVDKSGVDQKRACLGLGVILGVRRLDLVVDHQVALFAAEFSVHVAQVFPQRKRQPSAQGNVDVEHQIEHVGKQRQCGVRQMGREGTNGFDGSHGQPVAVSAIEPDHHPASRLEGVQAGGNDHAGLRYVVDHPDRDHIVEAGIDWDFFTAPVKNVDAIGRLRNIFPQHLDRVGRFDRQNALCAGGQQHEHYPAGAATDFGYLPARDLVQGQERAKRVDKDVDRSVVPVVVRKASPLIAEIGDCQVAQFILSGLVFHVVNVGFLDQPGRRAAPITWRPAPRNPGNRVTRSSIVQASRVSGRIPLR